MCSCSAKSWPAEGFPRGQDCLHVPASQCVCPGKTPPWSLTFTCMVICWPEQGVELWMEKVTSPRSPSWLAEPGLNACPASAPEGLFLVCPWLSVLLQGGRWQCWAGDALWSRPLLWRQIPVGLGLSAKCSTGAQRAEQEDAKLSVRAGQPHRVGSTHVPRCLGHFQLVLSGGAQSDAFGPHLLSFASPVRWQHLSCLSLPAAVGGSQSFPLQGDTDALLCHPLWEWQQGLGSDRV